MNKFQSFQDFLTTQSVHISVWGFVFNLLIAGVVAIILGRIYVKFGRSLSNRRDFAGNFVLITMTTMVIITVVKSSLALSLGLVGALSIVRFRAAIKEPEELTFLFLAIAIGLGLGADQRVITLLAFIIIIAVIWLVSVSRKSQEHPNLYLTVNSHNPKKIELGEIIEILNKHCISINLKRFDESNEVLEASFLVEFQEFTQLEEVKLDMQKHGESVRITFLDIKGFGGLG